MDDRDRSENEADDVPGTVGPQDAPTASAYSPPERRPGLARNPTMLAVVVVVAIALTVVVVLLTVGS